MADTVSLNIRNVPVETRERMLRAAASRGMNLATYLTALVSLHDHMRALADTPTNDGCWEQVATELEALGLQTVSS